MENFDFEDETIDGMAEGEISEEEREYLSDLIEGDWYEVFQKVESVVNPEMAGVPLNVERIDNKFNPLAETRAAVARSTGELLSVCVAFDDSYFNLKPEYRIGAILHEMAHCEVIFRSSERGDIQGLKTYSGTEGHTEEWKEIVKEMASVYPKGAKHVTETINFVDQKYWMEDQA